MIVGSERRTEIGSGSERRVSCVTEIGKGIAREEGKGSVLAVTGNVQLGIANGTSAQGGMDPEETTVAAEAEETEARRGSTTEARVSGRVRTINVPDVVKDRVT